MKTNNFLLLIFLFLFFASCKTSEKTSETTVINDLIVIESSEKLKLSLLKGEAFNNPTFVIWQEDMNGNYLKTLFITKSYASGIFGHQLVGDSIWLNKSGKSIQPAALPYWTHRKGLIKGKDLVPNPENPFVDGFSGATPNANFELNTSVKNQNNQYRILVEVNQTWDWNKFWTNNKYPDSPAYKHSSQPSLIYAVTITAEGNEFYLNPIGHGCATGESGKLFTDITTLTSAKNIFKEIKVTTY